MVSGSVPGNIAQLGAAGAQNPLRELGIKKAGLIAIRESIRIQRMTTEKKVPSIGGSCRVHSRKRETAIMVPCINCEFGVESEGHWFGWALS